MLRRLLPRRARVARLLRRDRRVLLAGGIWLAVVGACVAELLRLIALGAIPLAIAGVGAVVAVRTFRRGTAIDRWLREVRAGAVRGWRVVRVGGAPSFPALE